MLLTLYTDLGAYTTLLKNEELIADRDRSSQKCQI